MNSRTPPSDPVQPLGARRLTLGELASATGMELAGGAETTVDRVASLLEAGPGAVSFLANTRYRRQLAQTRATAVILHPAESLEGYPFEMLYSTNPYLDFARVARLLNPLPAVQPGIAPSAVVAADARVDAGAEIGEGAVVQSGAQIGPGCRIAPGVVIADHAQLGADCRIEANAAILAGVRLGDRVHVQAGAVIGSDGFGFARGDDHWEAVPQLGAVVIGDDVSIGANTTVDRGSQGDTVIEPGCKLDNLVQVAHNVRIGAHTVIAANTGISGSTVIGPSCTIGGAVGIAGHLEIAAGTTLTGMAMVTGSITQPGVYSSGVPASPNRDWRRNAVRFGQLAALVRRVEQLEKTLGAEDKE
jgi:UDP-3-O-[3-hydroxymyristoyl] glucosamine N-acyltransferase